MPLNLASPGILVKEVDLTTGRIDPTTGKIGAIVGAFAKGPVNTPTLIENENDLVSVFGKPYTNSNQFETWFTASSFLAYGGSLRVVRAGKDGLENAGGNTTGTGETVTINSPEHYDNLGYDENTFDQGFVARNPGTWANGIRVGVIDGKADQIITFESGLLPAEGNTVIQGLTLTQPTSAGGTSIINAELEGVIVGTSGTNTIEVKISRYKDSDTGLYHDVDYNSLYRFSGSGEVSYKTTAGVVVTTSGIASSMSSQADWFDAQTLELGKGSSGTKRTVKWNTLVSRPGTTSYAESKSSRFDEMHVVVIDGTGEITGNPGTILEKHQGLSKAKDAEFSAGSASYWRKYLRNNSQYVFGGQGGNIGAGVSVGYAGTDYKLSTDDIDKSAEGSIFVCFGAQNLELENGLDYDGTDNGINKDNADALEVTAEDVASGYTQFGDGDIYDVDFLLMGSAGYSKGAAQGLAQKLIAVANQRKDALAFISPYKGSMIDSNNAPMDDPTDKVLEFFSPLTSSSYAVFDSGYKYMYDRFNDKYRYIPLNGDIAGLCARNDINNFPWFSPAGTVRGGILNAVKLAYNPDKGQRDKLYSERINPVIFSPGAGIVLFGDKTGLGKASAFDRINVRRLFIYLEDAIGSAAKDALFEFNDEITRTNFVNTVEPFLRDVQAKRGITDYVVICDESNNTGSVIDSNEFVADIYVKPARSINFVGLTFVATKTGVSFEEVIGNF